MKGTENKPAIIPKPRANARIKLTKPNTEYRNNPVLFTKRMVIGI